LEANTHHYEECHVLPCKHFANNIVSKLAQYKAPQHVIDALLKTCRSGEQGRILLTACKLGASAEAAQSLMNVNPSVVDLQDSWGRTPLSFAVALDLPNPILVIKLLGAFPDMMKSADNEGRTPLTHCVMNNVDNTIVLLKLLESSLKLASVAEQSGRLPLHYLCERMDASLEELKLLLEAHPRGATEPDNYGNTALHCTWEVCIEMNANKGHILSARGAKIVFEQSNIRIEL
jgi:ankyrin repeat protein